jgi:hypothetical protein
LHAIRIYTESEDPFFDSVPINVWSMVEVNVGVWCASIPGLKALCSKRKGGYAGSGYEWHGRGKSGVSGRSGAGASGERDQRREEIGLEGMGRGTGEGGKWIAERSTENLRA